MKNNRTLENLRQMYDGHVYLRFNNQQEYDEFLLKAENEGFSFGEHQPTEYLGKPWDIISLLEGKQLAFCGSVSHMAYNSGAVYVHRIDYAAYARSDGDYLI